MTYESSALTPVHSLALLVLTFSCPLFAASSSPALAASSPIAPPFPPPPSPRPSCAGCRSRRPRSVRSPPAWPAQTALTAPSATAPRHTRSWTRAQPLQVSRKGSD